MKRIVIEMMIGFGESQETVSFEYVVPEDWQNTPENLAVIYGEFRTEAILDIEDVSCYFCGYGADSCECDEVAA